MYSVLVGMVLDDFYYYYYFIIHEDTIVRFSAADRTIPLVSAEVKFIRVFAGITPSGGVKVRNPSIDSENSHHGKSLNRQLVLRSPNLIFFCPMENRMLSNL